MEDYDIMTREEAEKKLEVLRQIFPIVRLVRGYTVMDLNGKTGAMEGLDKMETAPPCECFAFWQKNEPCRNCISQRMMEEHGQTSKLEFLGREMYQVTARYVEIDGEPYVMEMLQKQDSQNFIDEDGCKKLIGSLMKYNHMVYMDALTGVYNRRYFEDEIKNKTNTAGVAVIDMDYLKVINDTYGHRAGDHAIEMMVNVIRQNIRKTDSLIRYGGDEFLLILPEISKDSFNEKLKMIQEKIHDTAIADYGNLRLSVSIGGVITRDGREYRGGSSQGRPPDVFRERPEKHGYDGGKDRVSGRDDAGIFKDTDHQAEDPHRRRFRYEPRAPDRDPETGL